jgi:hypothetical protein
MNLHFKHLRLVTTHTEQELSTYPHPYTPHWLTTQLKKPIAFIVLETLHVWIA